MAEEITYTINFDSMGKSKKSLSELQKDLQTIKSIDMAKIFGGKLVKKNKWNNGLGGITPQ